MRLIPGLCLLLALPGAEARVYRAGAQQQLGLRMLDTGGGYNAQNALPVHIALPDLSPVDIEVRSMSAGGPASTWKRAVNPAGYAGKYLAIRVEPDNTAMETQ